MPMMYHDISWYIMVWWQHDKWSFIISHGEISTANDCAEGIQGAPEQLLRIFCETPEVNEASKTEKYQDWDGRCSKTEMVPRNSVAAGKKNMSLKHYMVFGAVASIWFLETPQEQKRPTSFFIENIGIWEFVSIINSVPRGFLKK